MKKLTNCHLYFLIIVILFSNAYSKVNIGLLSGINVSTLISEPQGLLIISNNNYLGIGTVGEYNLYKNMSINLGLLYLGKGTKFKIQGQDDLNAKLNLEYIKLPFSVSYSFEMPFIKPYLHTGLFIEYNLTAKLQYKSPDYTSNKNIKDEIKDYNFGYLIGGGLKKIMGKSIVFIEMYYSRGLLNLYNIDNNSDSSIYTKGIQIYLGFKYTIF